MNLSLSGSRQPLWTAWSLEHLQHEHTIALGFALEPASIASYIVFAGPVHRTELNRTMVRSIFRLRLPEFGAIPVASCRVSKIF